MTDIIKIPEIIQVKEFAKLINQPVVEVISKLISFGVLANINQDIDFDTASIIADEFGIQVSPLISPTFPSLPTGDKGGVREIKGLKPRPPVITVMGHVDHGKTTLLDFIRKTQVAKSEVGGITQHLSSYLITIDNRDITFIDTPGHSAFEATRQHGAMITDLVILVVAADDGVKPQTIEVINHAQTENVPILVAINKIDKPEADIEKTKRQLADLNLIPEEWGGQALMIPIVASTGQGVDKLLEMIFLITDLKNLQADPNTKTSGVILESHMTPGIGPQASVLIQSGTLKLGDYIVAGDQFGKIKTLTNGKLKKVSTIGPGYCGIISGLSGCPEFAYKLIVVSSDKEAKTLAKEAARKSTVKSIKQKQENDYTADEREGKIYYNIILKADTKGSIEALTKSFLQLENDDVGINIISSMIGDISENDLYLAKSANATILGFNIKYSTQAKKTANLENINIEVYPIIYELIESVENVLKQLMPKIILEIETARAEILAVFHDNRKNKVLGGIVKSGELTKSIIKILRLDKLIARGEIIDLQQGKNSVKSVKSGSQFGIEIKLTDFNSNEQFEIKVKDEILAYQIQEQKKSYWKKSDTISNNSSRIADKLKSSPNQVKI